MMRNLVSYGTGRTQTEGVWEDCTEDSTWP